MTRRHPLVAALVALLLPFFLPAPAQAGKVTLTGAGSAGASAPVSVPLDLQFTTSTYRKDTTTYGTLGAVPGATISTPAGFAETSTGAQTSFVANTPRITDMGALFEEASTNVLWTNLMTSVTTGDINSTGNLPSNAGRAWTPAGGDNGTVRTILGSGTENGFTYFDISWTGTPSASGANGFYFDQTSLAAAAASGQTWTSSVYVKVIGTPTGANRISLTVEGRASAGSGTEGSASTEIFRTVSTRQRFTNTFTLANASTARVTGALLTSFTSGVPINITLRVYMAQVEQKAYATSPIAVNGGAVTRAADAVTLTFTGGTTSSLLYQPDPRINVPNLVAPTAWTNALNTDTNGILAGNSAFSVQYPAKTWSLTAASDTSLRFEVRAGDVAPIDPGTKERSEIQGATNFNASQPVRVTYNFTIDPSSAANSAAWMVIGQFHQTAADGNSPPFAIELVGQKMAVNIAQPGADNYIWTDASNVVYGHTYQIQIDATFHATSGKLVVTRDGIVVVNYTGPLGWGAMGQIYWKEGIYRAATTGTMIATYDNTFIAGNAAPTVSSPINLGSTSSGAWVNAYLRSATVQ